MLGTRKMDNRKALFVSVCPLYVTVMHC